VVQAVQQADLSAQTSGRVTAVHVDLDDRVAAGQVLLRLSAVEQQAGADSARAQLRAAEAAAAEAQATYARYLALGNKQFVSRLQLDQVRAARDAAVAARDAARAQLAQTEQQADYTVVRAPFAGVVSARRVEPGESVAPGQPLMSVYAPGALRIEAQLPEADAAAIRAASGVRVLLADGRVLAAGALTIAPAADPDTHTVTVRVALPEMEAAPQPGVTAKLVFQVAGDAVSLEIPRSALVQRGEISGVYVLAGNRLALRQLRLGAVRGERVEVLAGLKSGELIAADPIAALQALAAQRQAGANARE
jgi:RND family efflux transporter MFP subunit